MYLRRRLLVHAFIFSTVRAKWNLKDLDNGIKIVLGERV